MSKSSFRPLNVIIAGGGIAGLAAAGYLRAQHNVTVLVFEWPYSTSLITYPTGS
jgi:2-polyprenyl-6-methoxyphenol hydroxylase-like FAD-dependent oxidoreductase